MQIYPPSSVAYAPASPLGEAFCTLCEHGKYVFVLWIAFASPPHQSLSRQLPPKGKPFLHCANRVNMTLSCGSPLRSALIRRLRHQTACSLASKATDEGGRYCSRSSPCCVARKDSCKRLPLGGKKTAGSLSRQRLMRGDKSALPIGCIFPRTGTTHRSFRSDHQLT